MEDFVHQSDSPNSYGFGDKVDPYLSKTAEREMERPPELSLMKYMPLGQSLPNRSRPRQISKSVCPSV
jgi:hypothetical protein